MLIVDKVTLDDDDEIAYFTMRWKTRASFVYRCGEFPMPQIGRKSKQVKEQWRGKFYLQSVRRKTRYIKHQKY